MRILLKNVKYIKKEGQNLILFNSLLKASLEYADIKLSVNIYKGCTSLFTIKKLFVYLNTMVVSQWTRLTYVQEIYRGSPKIEPFGTPNDNTT